MARKKGSANWARYKNKKRLQRKGVHYLPNPGYLDLGLPVEDDSRENLVAPKNFSLLKNRNKVIEYLEKVVRNIQEKKYSIMNMRDIQNTDLATIGVVISMMMDKRVQQGQMRKYMNVYVPPPNTPAGKLFGKAEFHQTVTNRGIAKNTYFLSRRSTKVNSDYIEDVWQNAVDFLGKENTKYLSPIMVELMKNTNNHANPNKAEDSQNIPWFLAVVEDKHKGIMTFTIVDLGVGIFESLRLKNLADTSGQPYDVVTDMYENAQSTFLRTHIPKGVSSSTGLFYRGTGLKQVYDLANKGNYVTFKVVTNRAIVDMLNVKDAARDSDESFGGTIYYWEMSKNG
jgi:hypothetical protein